MEYNSGIHSVQSLVLGIIPVIPSFNGIIPKELMALYPNETYWPLRKWGHFSAQYTGLYYLMPDSDLFQLIQQRFHQFYTLEYGNASHFYAFDTFNEMAPPIGDLDFIQNYGLSMIKTLQKMDPKATWVSVGPIKKMIIVRFTGFYSEFLLQN